LILPTSLSSTWPWKIMSPMLATVAIVVPGLKLFDSMTLWPFLTGTSMTMPSTVAVTTTLDAGPPRVAPSLTIVSPEPAEPSSCWRSARSVL
jgi:hypothetical protein